MVIGKWNVLSVERFENGKRLRVYTFSGSTGDKNPRMTGTNDYTCYEDCCAVYDIQCTNVIIDGQEYSDSCGEVYIGTECSTYCVDNGDVCSGSSCGGGSQGHTVTQFKNQIADKPFALLPNVPCSILEKWIATARYNVGQTQINKLNKLFER